MMITARHGRRENFASKRWTYCLHCRKGTRW